MNNWILYRYTMELLIDEETALGLQSRWYKGSEDGRTWIYEVVEKLTKSYYEGKD